MPVINQFDRVGNLLQTDESKNLISLISPLKREEGETGAWVYLMTWTD